MTHENIADLLAEEAEQAELHRDDELTPGFRRARPSREPAQVYSLRIPVEWLEQLRSHAADRHMTPSALMRAWVIERLEAEATEEAAPDDANRPGSGSSKFPMQTLRLVIREELERANTRPTSAGKASRVQRRARQLPGRERAEIRAWARQHGYKVSEHGKIPGAIVRDYNAAVPSGRRAMRDA
jgi:hypothetical protein